jgi:hypothetical protein
MAGYTRGRKSDRRIIAEIVKEWINADLKRLKLLCVGPAAVFPLKSTNADPYIGRTQRQGGDHQRIR